MYVGVNKLREPPSSTEEVRCRHLCLTGRNCFANALSKTQPFVNIQDPIHDSQIPMESMDILTGSALSGSAEPYSTQGDDFCLAVIHQVGLGFVQDTIETDLLLELANRLVMVAYLLHDQVGHSELMKMLSGLTYQIQALSRFLRKMAR